MTKETKLCYPFSFITPQQFEDLDDLDDLDEDLDEILIQNCHVNNSTRNGARKRTLQH